MRYSIFDFNYNKERLEIKKEFKLDLTIANGRIAKIISHTKAIIKRKISLSLMVLIFSKIIKWFTMEPLARKNHFSSNSLI